MKCDKANLDVLEIVLKQPGAEIIDIIDGCLLDDYFLIIDGVYMIFEVVFVNTWQSNYNWYTSLNGIVMCNLWNKIKEGRK